MTNTTATPGNVKTAVTGGNQPVAQTAHGKLLGLLNYSRAAQSVRLPSVINLRNESGVPADAMLGRITFKNAPRTVFKDQSTIPKLAIVHHSQHRVGVTASNVLSSQIMDNSAAPMKSNCCMISQRNHRPDSIRLIGHTAVPHSRVAETNATGRNFHARGRTPTVHQFRVITEALS